MGLEKVSYGWLARATLTVMACGVAAVRWQHPPAVGGVVAAAVITAAIWWFLTGLSLSNAIWSGLVSQDMTWHARLRPDGPVHRGGPIDPDTEFMVGQMRQVEDRVQDFIRASDLEHVSLAVTGGRIGLWHEAASTRSGRSGHVDLGYFWLFPDRSNVLPYILEHELAHLRRNDARARLGTTTLRAALIVLCAGLLPLAQALLVLAVLTAVGIGYQWWTELACDREAARHCGRRVAVAAWKQDLADTRQIPLVRRLWAAFLALRSHPPMLLRVWWARLAPSGSA
ncbi:M48 family metallopeptidase (plasmid) [Streptomyces sp. NBC_01023]|uniref:hypothetical protein n=1 Tax=unclassified Streptomyces TaxID=2593676 RepID=UPI002F913F77|nr:M48 family metallopeptidase [Streptomyces sp. NBC_01023]